MAGKLSGGAIQSGTITTTQISSALNTTISAGGGPKISTIIYPGDDTAANTNGGQTLYITGSGFKSNSTVYINGNNVPSVSFISASNLSFTGPVLSAATYPVYVINPEDGATAILIPGLQVSGEPTWVTSATLAEQEATGTWNISLSATGDETITYALAAGSSLPAGISLASNGVISGTLSSPPETDTTYNFTVDAIDAQNQSSSRAFSVTASTGEGVLFANNVLLIHADGTNNQNNHTFLDSSSNGLTITRAGNATQGSFSPFSQTGWSGYFDGSGDYLSVADNAALQMGTDDFTIECWIYLISTPSTVAGVASKRTSATSTGTWAIDFGANTTDLRYRILNSSVVTVSIGTVLLNSWNHIAVSKQNGTTKTFLNGIAGGTTTDATAINGGANSLLIGAGDSTYFPGYISNFRVVKGTAVYTGAFTPTSSPLTAISNTSLLTCQSNRFIDNSTNAFTITRNGDTSIQTFSPFAPTAAYTAANVGGSAYFDGSGDYINIAKNDAFDLGSGDFTIECWAHPIGAFITGTPLFGQIQSSGSARNSWTLRTNSSGNPELSCSAGVNQDVLITSNVAISKNVWSHIAATREGTAFKLFVDGSLVGTATSSITLNHDATYGDVLLGASRSGATYDRYYNGIISGARLVKGTAVYTSAFTPPTSPPTNIANTAFLANFTNAQIFDQTAKNVFETVGDVKVSTAQYKYGTGSIAFDGTGDYLAFPASPNFTFGTGDFTIETWFQKTANTANSQTLFDHRSSEPSVAPFIGIIGVTSTANDNKIEYYANGVQRITSNSAILNNVWYHVAVVRYNSNTTLYIDGVSAGNTIFYDTSNYNTSTLRVGGRFAAVTGDFRNFNGYIDDLRITKGFARYTSNFTPPTSALKDR